LAAAALTYGSRGVTFLGVNVPWDKEADALRFVDEQKASYAMLRGGVTMLSLYGVDATPVTYVIGRTGKVTATKVGALEPPELARLIEGALAKS
jgi:hypothetical protein